MTVYELASSDLRFSQDNQQLLLGKFARAYISTNQLYTLEYLLCPTDKKFVDVLKRMANCYQALVLVENKGLLISVNCTGSNTANVKLLDETNFLNDLSALIGIDTGHVRVTISEKVNIKDGDECGVSFKKVLITTDMRITDHPVYCEDVVSFSSVKWERHFQRCKTTQEFHVKVELVMDPTFFRFKTPKLKLPKRVACEKMLVDEIHCDTTIITSNGNRLKCHKSVLSACSPVLATMFQTEMVESATHQIEIPDITEEGLKAFLSYVYYLNDKEPNKHCEIAFELLYASHKYNVPNLEEDMTKLMLSKSLSWFMVDETVKIFSLACNIADGDKLKTKCVQVLNRNSKELLQSESYRTLFQKNPDAGMELCHLALSNKT